MLTSLQKAKENGCKIVFVNPLPEAGAFRFKNPQDLLHPLHMPRFLFGPGTQLSDLWLPVRINGDMAFFKGLMKELVEEEDRNPGKVLDHEFIAHNTEGYDALIRQIREDSWDEIVEFSGLSREQIGEAARIVLNSHRIIVCWCMGLTQHKNAGGIHPGDPEFPSAQGKHRQAGLGPVPRPGSLECAG